MLLCGTPVGVHLESTVVRKALHGCAACEREQFDGPEAYPDDRLVRQIQELGRKFGDYARGLNLLVFSEKLESQYKKVKIGSNTRCVC